jgi:hypothetical protein
VFGENALALDRHIEASAAAADDLAVDAELFLDLSRQTGGSGKVVSNAAVLDSDMHQAAPIWFQVSEFQVSS